MTALRNRLLYVALICSVACDTASELSFGEEPVTHSIGYLKSLCISSSTDIRTDISIRGTVTANDLFGEFYKTIIIADPSGGIEIVIDDGRLAKEYPTGSVVTVSCNGLALGRSGGSIQLGKHPTGEYTVDRIPQQEQRRYIRKHDSVIEQPHPITTTIAKLSAMHITSYVRIDGVGFTAEEQGLKWFDQEADTTVISYTDRHIVDRHGDTLAVRTSHRCRYAKEPLPEGSGSICGIIDYAQGKYLLKVTNREFDFSFSE